MAIEYSDLVSQRYCKACGSFNIERIHRGIFKKFILKSPRKYRCNNCKKIFTGLDFERNEIKKMPLFIE